MMDLRAPLVAGSEPAEAAEPGQRTLHHPTVAAHLQARLGAPPQDAPGDAPLASGGSVAREIVTLVGVQLRRASPRPTRPTPLQMDRQDCIEQGLQQLRVVSVGRPPGHREWNSSSVDHHTAVAALFAAARRIRHARSAPALAGTLTKSSEARDESNLSASAGPCNSPPFSGVGIPALQVAPLPARHPAAAAEFRPQQIPSDAALEDRLEAAGMHGRLVPACAAPGEQQRDHCSHLVADERFAHAPGLGPVLLSAFGWKTWRRHYKPSRYRWTRATAKSYSPTTGGVYNLYQMRETKP